MSFKKIIISWYIANKRLLPWRNTTNPYHIWLSEIILQQTQVKQGLPYYNRFISSFPTVFDLAKASEKDVLKLWQGLGYYSRARHLHQTAQIIAKDYQGEFPSKYEEIIALKGIGDYTASAIASICFNLPTAVVDGNVYRVLSRYFDIDTPINTGKGFKEFKALAQDLIDTEQPATFNQAIMEFGATHCKPKNPLCGTCPFNDSCLALKENSIKFRPIKLKKIKIKTLYFNYIVFITPKKHTIIEQRTQGIWKNMYQFPLIETTALVKDFSIKNKIKDMPFLIKANYNIYQHNETPLIHKLTHKQLHTLFWIVTLENELPNSIPFKNIKNYPVPVLIDSFINTFNF